MVTIGIGPSSVPLGGIAKISYGDVTSDWAFATGAVASSAKPKAAQVK
jgi:hypothetical protein